MRIQVNDKTVSKASTMTQQAKKTNLLGYKSYGGDRVKTAFIAYISLCDVLTWPVEDIQYIAYTDNPSKDIEEYGIQIQDTDSDYPIYLELNEDGCTLNYWSPADVIYAGSSANGLFRSFPSVKSIDVSHICFDYTVNAQNLFVDDEVLESIPGLETRQFGNCEFFDRMFSGTHYTNIEILNSWDLVSARTMDEMFAVATTDNPTESAELNLNTPNLISINNFLGYSVCTKSLTINFTADMPQLEFATGLCIGIQGLEELTINWKEVSDIFDLTQFAFSNDALKTVELSFDKLPGRLNIGQAFGFCSELTTIGVQKNFLNIGKTTTVFGDDVFEDCVALVGGAGTTYDPNKIGADMFCVDLEGRPGYLKGPVKGFAIMKDLFVSGRYLTGFYFNNVLRYVATNGTYNPQSTYAQPITDDVKGVIVKTDAIPPTDARIVTDLLTDESSAAPIYTWKGDDDIIIISSPDSLGIRIKPNADFGEALSRNRSCKICDLHEIDGSNITEMSFFATYSGIEVIDDNCFPSNMNNVVGMECAFEYAYGKKVVIRNVDFSSCTDYVECFNQMSNLESLEWRFTAAPNTCLDSCFSNQPKIKEYDIKIENSTNIVSASALFMNNTSLEVFDFGEINLSSCANFQNMFRNCPELQWVNFGNLLITNSSANISGLFLGDTALTTVFVKKGFTCAVTSITEGIFDGGATDLSGYYAHTVSEAGTGLSAFKLDNAALANAGLLSPKPVVLKDGKTINKLLKSLVNSNVKSFIDPDNTIVQIGLKFPAATGFNFPLAPPSGATTVELGKDGSCVAWAEDVDTTAKTKRIYVYSENFVTGDYNRLFFSLISSKNLFPSEDESYMFYNFQKLRKLQISWIQLNRGKNFDAMFANCRALRSILVNFGTDLYDNDKERINYGGTRMFGNDEHLVGARSTKWKENQDNLKYAAADGGKDDPGYFTPDGDEIPLLNAWECNLVIKSVFVTQPAITTRVNVHKVEWKDDPIPAGVTTWSMSPKSSAIKIYAYKDPNGNGCIVSPSIPHCHLKGRITTDGSSFLESMEFESFDMSNFVFSDATTLARFFKDTKCNSTDDVIGWDAADFSKVTVWDYFFHYSRGIDYIHLPGSFVAIQNWGLAFNGMTGTSKIIDFSDMDPAAVMSFVNYYYVFDSPDAHIKTIYVPEGAAEWGAHLPANPNDNNCFRNCTDLVGRSADGKYTYKFDGVVLMGQRGFVPSATHPQGYLSIKPKE